MNNRVYVLLDVIKGKSKEVVNTLTGKGGVISADAIEDPPGVVMVVEASERKQLAALTVKAIASVDNFTRGLRLLPVSESTGLASAGIGSGALAKTFTGQANWRP